MAAMVAGAAIVEMEVVVLVEVMVAVVIVVVVMAPVVVIACVGVGCIVLYPYIYIALLAKHTNQKRVQCVRPRDKSAVWRERKEAFSSPVN